MNDFDEKALHTVAYFMEHFTAYITSLLQHFSDFTHVVLCNCFM